MTRIFQVIAVAAVAPSAAGAQPVGSSLKQRIAAILSRPEYVHARFDMEFWPLDADKPAYQFNEQQRDGNAPEACLVIDQNEVLYGTTYKGGISRVGTVFALRP